MSKTGKNEETLLDRYCVLRTAGEGAEGKVQICWDPTVQRRVAIKTLPLSTRDSQGGTPGLAEARTAALLKHQCIVSLLDFKADGDSAHIIMEAVEGPSLRKLLDGFDDELLDLNIIAHITQGVASALDYAHENGVLHLDVKPDNILIEMSGQVKVSDFGVSELADAQGYGQACGGTIGYMPPEQIAGQDLDQRADVFALAVVVYEMLTGEKPFAAKNLNQALNVLDAFKVDPPSAFRDDVDTALDDIVLGAMSPLKQERPETIVDFMSQIEDHLGDPRKGIRELRQLISDEEEGEDEDEEREPSEGIWGHMGPKARSVMERIGATVFCWFVGFMAAGCFGLPSTLLSAAAACLPAIIAAFAPSIGTLVSLLALGVGIIYTPAVTAPVGVILIVVTLVWWVPFGLRDAGSCCLALAAAPLGLVYFIPVLPLLGGFFLGPKRGTTATVMAAFLALTLQVATGGSSIVHLGVSVLTQPDANLFYQSYGSAGTWITMASWVVAALVMGLFCLGRDRILSIIGAFLCGCIMVAVQVLIQWIETGSWGIPTFIWIATSLGAIICIVVLSILGAPDHSRGED